MPTLWMLYDGQQQSRYLICDGKRYTFPYYLYYCFWHGWFIYKRQRHQLVDFLRIKDEAIKVEPELRGVGSSEDYRIL